MHPIQASFPSVRAAAASAVLVLVTALPAFAIRPITLVSRAAIASVWDYDASDPELTKLPGKTAGTIGKGMDRVFDGSFANTNAVYMSAGKNGASLVLEFHRLQGNGSAANMGAYISEVIVGHVSNCDCKYSLYWSDTITNKNTTAIQWNPVPDAQNVNTPGITNYTIKARAMYLKYVFDTTTGNDSLTEIQVKGWKSTIPAIISDVARSHFIRGGTVSNGEAGTNGGHYSNRFFNGNFEDYTICNNSGVTELIIPTTDSTTGEPQYVTEFKVGHRGNSKYSLYYTTDAEPDYSQYETTSSRSNGDGHWHTCTNYVGLSSDDRNWIAIDGATGIQEQGTKTFNVNQTATGVKYVFDTFVSWDTSLAEVEVLAMDPEDLPCTHTNLDLATATWTVCKPATCTENTKEECFCPDCGERFEREVSYTKLGHIYVATLTSVGRPNRYGSGFVSCSRTLEDPDTHETTWSCDFRIDFDGRDVDFTTLGGIPINGVVQYTDLTASSSGGQDGGISPEDVKDNVWNTQWNGYWFAEGLSTNEYVQYQFGTTIELTKIEFSVLNEFQTVYFSKYDPETGEETLLRTIPIAKVGPVAKLDEQGNMVTNELGEVVYENVGYQRQTVDFFVYDKLKKTFVDAIRMRIGDYVDPVTGETTTYPGTGYGSHNHTCIIEFHPWGTIQWAGLMTQPPTTIMLMR